ncbi:MAG: outer membrane beta-barrel protein [Mangrovibacterium sp.]
MKIRLIIYFSFLFAFGAFQAKLQAQEWSGMLCDSTTNTVLPSANIVLRNAENLQLIEGVMTDPSGKFKIQHVEPGNYIAQFSFIGYQSKAVHFSMTDADLNLGAIKLTQILYVLEEVSTFEPLFEYDGENVSLNVEALGDVENLSATDVIEMIPGAYFDIDGKLHYHGYTDFTKLLNGEKVAAEMMLMGSEGTEYFKLKQIPAKHIKTIELFPEPGGRYGFFEPIMNIITKGDLMDYYTANGELGSYDKCKGSLGFMKLMGKLRISSNVGYSSFSEKQRIEEERHYTSLSTDSYARERKQHQINKNGNLTLNTGYNINDDNKFTASWNSNLFSNSKNNNCDFLQYTNGLSQIRLQEQDNVPQNNQYDFNYSHMSTIGIRQRLFINAKVFKVQSTAKEEQIQRELESVSSLNKYRLHKVDENKKLRVSLRYFNNKKETKYSILGSFPVSLSQSSSSRENYNQSTNSWESQSIYYGNNKYMQATPEFGINVYRKFFNKNESTFQNINSSITQQFRYEKIDNLLQNTTDINKDFRTNFSGSFKHHFKNYGTYLASYNGNMRMPNREEKAAAPQYLDDFTLISGNSELIPELTHNVKVGYAWITSGFISVNKKTSATEEKKRKTSHSIYLNYTHSTNKIIRSYREENSIAIHSWENTDDYQLLACNASFSWKVTPKLSWQIDGEYNMEQYDGENKNTSWDISSQINAKLPLHIQGQLRYSYDSPRYYYTRKVFERHDASFSLSKLLFKNTLHLSLEGKNLLAHMGQRTELYASSFDAHEILYQETFVVWIKASLKLYKFYEK